MHDLMTDIDWRTVNTERLLDGIDGAHDARAETARRTEKNMSFGLTVMRRWAQASIRLGVRRFACQVQLAIPLAINLRGIDAINIMRKDRGKICQFLKTFIAAP